MDSYPEVIVVAGAKVEMYNAENANVIRHFTYSPKTGAIHPNTLTLLGEDYLVGAVADRPALKVFAVSKKVNAVAEFTLPGHASSFAATSCGAYCFAGFGKDLYVWKVTTGNLLAIIYNDHYQEITCIKCSSDDSHVITGGKDGFVHVWLLADLVAANRASNQKKPRFIWNHHSNEITDIYLTSLGCNARVVTVSADMICRLYELASGTLITTIFMEVALTTVTMDPLECFIFIGDVKGSVHRINIFERLPREMYVTEMKKSEFKLHESKIVSLDVSFEGNKLVSSSDDGCVRVWDMQSFSCILRINVEGPLTNAFITLAPRCFMDSNILPLFDMVYFKRNLEESCSRKETNIKPGRRTMTDMISTPKELCYNPSSLYKDAITGEDASKPDGPDTFDRLCNGDTLNEMVEINNRVYAQSTTLIFDMLATNKICENPDEEMGS